MTIDHRTMRLQRSDRFDQLIAFLRDDMDWPVVSDDFEELTFEYSAEELGIDAVNAAKIQEIKRLRPLAAEPALGHLLYQVRTEAPARGGIAQHIGTRGAQEPRFIANNAEQTHLGDGGFAFHLQLRCEGDARQISFAHFAAPPDSIRLPTLKVVAWDERGHSVAPGPGSPMNSRNGLAWPDR